MGIRHLTYSRSTSAPSSDGLISTPSSIPICAVLLVMHCTGGHIQISAHIKLPSIASLAVLLCGGHAIYEGTTCLSPSVYITTTT